jgi:hypothetical protein
MTVRVRYTGNELYPEGVVEVVREANRWEIDDDGSLLLRAEYRDEDGRRKIRTVGVVREGRWDIAVVMSDELVDCE